MNYKDFNLGDWIGHISGVIEDESELDGNEMRDLLEFLTTLNPCDDCVSRDAVIELVKKGEYDITGKTDNEMFLEEVNKLPSVQPKRDKGDKE